MEIISLNTTYPATRRISWWKVASFALHLLVLAALMVQIPTAIQTLPRPKARVLIPYSPGRSAAPQPPKPKVIQPKDEPKLAMKEPDPPPPSNGGDPSGEADVTLAMANFFPAPKPDLAALPHGTSGDVVVDIVIDEQGKVVDSHLDQGLGHGVDEAVLATVQTWTFWPATKAGKAVASSQQLLFHFDRA
jgi:protein TonB